MYYDMMESGSNIRNLRIQHGYTQEQLAKALNIDRSYLSRVEAGQKGCSVDLFIQLSNFFQVSIDYLVLGIERYSFTKAEDVANMKKDISELIECLKLFKDGL